MILKALPSSLLVILWATASFSQTEVELVGEVEIVEGSLEVGYRLGNYGDEYPVRGEIVNNTNHVVFAVLLRITIVGDDGIEVGSGRRAWTDRHETMVPGEVRRFSFIIDAQMSQSESEPYRGVTEDHCEVHIQFIALHPYVHTSHLASSGWGVIKRWARNTHKPAFSWLVQRSSPYYHPIQGGGIFCQHKIMWKGQSWPSGQALPF